MLEIVDRPARITPCNGLFGAHANLNIQIIKRNRRLWFPVLLLRCRLPEYPADTVERSQVMTDKQHREDGRIRLGINMKQRQTGSGKESKFESQPQPAWYCHRCATRIIRDAKSPPASGKQYRNTDPEDKSHPTQPGLPSPGSIRRQSA